MAAGRVFSWFVIASALRVGTGEAVSRHAADSGVNAMSGQRQALLGFEKYTANLLNKVIDHNLTITSQEQAAIDTILAFIDSMFANAYTSFQADLDNVATCNTRLGNCQQQFPISSLLPLQNSWDTTRAAHHKCRTQQKPLNDSKILACDDYDAYRKNDESALFPACGVVPDDHLRPAYIKTNALAELEKMEACLQAVHDWDAVLYPKYELCRDARNALTAKDTECDGLQHSSEEDYCLFELEFNTSCHTYEICWDLVVDSCDGEGELDTCTIVNNSGDARIADNETGERIKCLLQIFNLENEYKQGNLTACIDADYSTSGWDIQCPPEPRWLVNGAAPPPPKPSPNLPSCDPRPAEPCSAQYIEEVYSSQDWFGSVDLEECHSSCEAAP